jgi:hypothetical protein
MVVVSSLIGSGGVGSGKVGASAWRGPDAVAVASAGRSRQRAQASGTMAVRDPARRGLGMGTSPGGRYRYSRVSFLIVNQ